MERLTKDERAEARARADAATPGPWNVAPDCRFEVLNCYGGMLLMVSNTRDADFIAHAREDLLRALDDIDSLQAENERLRKRCEAAEEILRRQIQEGPETVNICEFCENDPPDHKCQTKCGYYNEGFKYRGPQEGAPDETD